MRNLFQSFALALVAASSLAEGNPCSRTISGRHDPQFLNSASEGLDFQRRCLIWEWSVQPKAEFIPSVEPPPVVSRVLVEQPVLRSSPQSFSELFARSVNLKAHGSVGALVPFLPVPSAPEPSPK